MATFSQLKGYIADWLNRNDLATQCGYFINIAIRKLETNPQHNWAYMRQVTTGSLADGDISISFPTRFKELQALYILNTDNQKSLANIHSLEYAWDQYPYESNVKSFPEIAAIDDANSRILLRPTVDQTYSYEMYYLQYTAEFTDDNDSNWMTVNHWELVLYGALVEAGLFLKDTELMQNSMVLYADKLKSLIETEIKRDMAGSPLTVVSGYVV